MANQKKITEVSSVNTLTNTDSLFVNSDGALKQIMMSNMSVGGQMMDLLWENPNPGNEFAAQNITLDLSEYEFFILKIKRAKTDSNEYKTVESILLSKEAIMVNIGPLNLSLPNSYPGWAYRFITITDNDIEFGDASTHMANTSSPVVANNYAIPVELYGIKSETTPIVNGIEIKKLWENASPTSDFVEQTINVNGLSDYDEYEIKFRFHKTLNLINTHKSIVGYGMLMCANDVTSIYRRNVTVSGNNLNFSNQVNHSSGESQNDYLIPVAIYGIKGVK